MTEAKNGRAYRAREKPLVIISLGWGVQSFTLAAMSALGQLPPVDFAIHSDTTHEKRDTYDFARRWAPWLEDHGVRIITVRAPEKRLNAFYTVNAPSTFLPAFTTWPDGRPSGMLRRQCTSDWKVAPIRRYLYGKYRGRKIQQWIGITLDEVARMRESDVQYIDNVYPFIDYLDRPWTRLMVMQWLDRQGLEIPTKSSCVFCPYHDAASWREIKRQDNGDWSAAVEADRAIRRKKAGYICYLHRDRIPLEEVDFRSEEDHGQLTLWSEAEECSGNCFL